MPALSTPKSAVTVSIIAVVLVPPRTTNVTRGRTVKKIRVWFFTETCGDASWQHGAAQTRFDDGIIRAPRRRSGAIAAAMRFDSSAWPLPMVHLGGFFAYKLSGNRAGKSN